MLKVQNLSVEIDGKKILRDINLEIGPGTIHVLMGPNGSGKSTFAKALVGDPDLKIVSGKIYLDQKDLTNMQIDQRARMGLFVAFQSPVEVPGVNFANFLRLAYNSRCSKDQKLPVFKFKRFLKDKLELLGLSENFLDRNLNEGFSGGEKKKAEVLQFAVLNPQYAIFDETDSGLDVDALKIVFSGIKKVLVANPKMGLLIITHYERVFEYIKPDYVHLIVNGSIVKSGDIKLIESIKKKGYRDYQKT